MLLMGITDAGINKTVEIYIEIEPEIVINETLGQEFEQLILEMLDESGNE